MYDNQFSLSFIDEANDKSISFNFSASTWHEALEEFTSFIGSAYGYSIKDQAAIKKSPFRIDPSVWTGPIFDEEIL